MSFVTQPNVHIHASICIRMRGALFTKSGNVILEEWERHSLPQSAIVSKRLYLACISMQNDHGFTEGTLVNFVFLYPDSAKRASTMALAAPSVRKWKEILIYFVLFSLIRTLASPKVLSLEN